MPHNLTEAATYEANVGVPDPSDAASAASVETPFQQLANRTKWLRDQGYGTFIIPISEGFRKTATEEWTFTHSTAKATSQNDGAILDFPIPRLPAGAQITRVRAVVDPTSASAVILRLEKLAHHVDAAAVPTFTSIDSVTTTGVSRQTLSLTVAEVPDPSTEEYMIVIESTITGDVLHSVEYTVAPP